MIIVNTSSSDCENPANTFRFVFKILFFINIICGGGILSERKDLDRYSFLVDLIAEEYMLLFFEDEIANDVNMK